MDNRVKMGLTFIAGLFVGAFATKLYMDKKHECEEYEEYEECEESEEIESENIDDDTNVEKVEKKEPVQYNKIKSVESENYVRMLNELRYKEEEETKKLLRDFAVEEENIDRTKPYQISQDEFEDRDAYESDEYTYYTDGFLTDSYGYPISQDDIINSIGVNNLENFKESDDDQMWVRNERLQMDFSIIKDVDAFVDVAPPRIKRMVGL